MGRRGDGGALQREGLQQVLAEAGETDEVVPAEVHCAQERQELHDQGDVDAAVRDPGEQNQRPQDQRPEGAPVRTAGHVRGAGALGGTGLDQQSHAGQRHAQDVQLHCGPRQEGEQGRRLEEGQTHDAVLQNRLHGTTLPHVCERAADARRTEPAHEECAQVHDPQRVQKPQFGTGGWREE